MVAAPLSADYQQGLDNFRHGQFDDALQQWMQVVMSPPGTVNPSILAETQYAIAMLHWLGQGVQQNFEASAHWLKEAANLNHTGAQTKLGFLYLYGQGVPKNDFEAFKWMQMAGQQGDADAQYNLGVMYRDGVGAEQNTERALPWFYEAAAQGDPISSAIVAEYQRSGNLPPSQLETEEQVVVGSSPATDGTQQVRPTSPIDQIANYQRQPERGAGDFLAGLSVMDEDWINDRDPLRYTIQVIALSSVANLEQLVERHADMAPLAVYRLSHRGNTLYVLLQGDYDDIDAARRARDVFPESMQHRDKILIRRFGSIKELMAKNAAESLMQQSPAQVADQ